MCRVMDDPCVLLRVIRWSPRFLVPMKKGTRTGQSESRRMDLASLLSLYRLHRPQLQDSTAETYRYAIVALEKHLGRTPTVNDLTEPIILTYLSRRLGEAAEWTCKRELGSLMLLWRFAWKKKLTQTDPRDADMPTVRLKQAPATAMTLDEFRAVLDSCRFERAKIAGTAIQKSLWWQSLLTAAYYSAARISALLATTWGDLDMDAGWLLLSADTAKTGIGQYCRLPEESLTLTEKLGKTSCMIWPQPYNRRWLWQSMRRIVKRAGLPDDRRYRFHAIRRTAATLAVANGSLEQARVLLGHTTQRMTARYIDPRIVTPQSSILPRVVG